MMLIDIDTRNIDNSDERKELYHRTSNFIYFFDNSNQSTSYNELNQIYKEAKEIWNNNIKFVLVNCVDSNSTTPKINTHKISNEYKCEIFEIDSNKNIENINKPFFSFLPKFKEYEREILKLGKEYRNPFNNINKEHINIGLFSLPNVNKTELGFRYIYGANYKIFYEDFINNFSDNKMDKIVEIKSQFYNVSILDSTFVNNNEDDFGSCYSAVQGIVFVFQIDLLSSSDFIKEINQFYSKAKESVLGEINIVIGLEVSEKDEVDDLYQNLFDQINQIEEQFQCEVFLFQIENGNNVEDMFYFLIKKIINKEQSKKETLLKKKTKRSKTSNARKKTKDKSKK